MEELMYFFPKVCVATLCGLIIGWEREMKNKVAGVRTNVMVCVGACIMTAFSFYMAKFDPEIDPTRIVGQIVTGIGFLGGGVIFKTQDRVVGVTSAAFIWVMCAIGLLCGSGMFMAAISLTIGLLIISILLHLLEKKYHGQKKDDQK